MATTAAILFLNVIFSEIAWAIFTRFDMGLSVERFGAIEKMGAMPIYGKRT